MIATESPRVEALKKVFAAYRADTSKYSAKAYQEGLADVPDDVLVKAIDEAIKGEAFMPTVARIRTYCDKVRPPVIDAPALPAVPVTKLLSGDTALDEHDPRLWVYCALCRDTGMVETIKATKPNYTMPVAVGSKGEIERRVIEVERKSYFHHCACRETNPKLVAQRQRVAKFSREED